MSSPSWSRSFESSSLRLGLTMLGLAAIALGEIEVSLYRWHDLSAPWVLVLGIVVCSTYIGAGLLAWWQRPSNRLGAIMIAAGFMLHGASLSCTSNAELVAAGLILTTTPVAAVVHLLHAFPSGRLRPGASRVTVVAGYFVALVLQAPQYLFAPHIGPSGRLSIVDRPELVSWGVGIQATAGSLVMASTTWILAVRLFRTSREQRWVLGPLYLYGSLAVLFMPISALILRPWLHIDELVVVGLQLIAIGPVPVLFALAVFKGGFARTAEIEELGAWLGTVGDLRPELTYALARTLGDPSIQLAFWVPQRDTYVDWSGAALALPASGSGRHAVEIELRAKRVGAIVYDATLIGDPDLVRKAGRVVAIAVDHERLTAELKASEEALRQSRARIAEAGYRERRRFAQDLHDGLQVRLVLLALEAQEIAGDPMATTETRHAATMLRAGIDSAASELRQLVHNVMPAPLVAHGLSAATEDLVDRMPVPTSLSLGVEDGELPKNIESTAYFVVAEALANAVKHAQAKKLDVNVAFADGQLLVRVSDDGIGGATPGNGAGLRGIADRVDVLGGTFSIDSPSGGGTVLVVALPYQ